MNVKAFERYHITDRQTDRQTDMTEIIYQPLRGWLISEVRVLAMNIN